MSYFKHSLLQIVLIAFVLSPLAAEAKQRRSKTTAPPDPFFLKAVSKLKDEGFSKRFIRLVERDKKVEINPAVVKSNLLHGQNPPSYENHTREMDVDGARAFLKKYQKYLNRCQKKTGVSKNVITALLSVETRFGKNTGKNHVLSVFLSLALANDPGLLGPVLEESKPEYVEKVKMVALRKSQWAIAELKALELIHRRGRADVTRLRGSYSGAFGMPQFLPTSLLEYGVDGNHDKKVDLYTIADTIYSVANYLKKNGWGPTRGQQSKALFRYNNSDDYVNTILRLADLLKWDGKSQSDTAAVSP